MQFESATTNEDALNQVLCATKFVGSDRQATRSEVLGQNLIQHVQFVRL